MRINAGKFKHHNIYMTNLDTTRETSDKVRQAIFNLLGQYFEDITVCDLFAGSGAMGLEALSRGASKCYFNDINKKACEVVKKNVNLLKVESLSVIYNLDYKEALKKMEENSVDIMFLDPPYKMNDTKGIIEEIDKYNIIRSKGIISFEMAKETITSEVNNYDIIKEKVYGIKKVVIYKKRESN